MAPFFMTRPFSFLTAGLILTSQVCFSQIVLPSVFSDHLVLERNTTVAVWGWDDPNDTVFAIGSWAPNDTALGGVTNDGHWRVDLKTGDAGGPYTLTLVEKHYHGKVVLQDLLLGEVWICSGQSNMEFTANWGLDNKQQAIQEADFPEIRFFHVPRIGAAFPQQDCRANWVACSPATMPNNTAVGYFFARRIHETLKVPVGIIEAAWGGTNGETWVRAEQVSGDANLQAHFYDEHSKRWPDRPGDLYNGMISPFIPYGVAGALWYQGESNTYQPGAYAVLLDSLVTGWRRDFGRDFPFYFVQIAPYRYDPRYQKAFLLREQEDMAQHLIPNSGMVSIGDLAGDTNDIHPKDKLDVGERLAAYALAETYHVPISAFQNPSYKNITVHGNKITVTFDHAEGGLMGKPVNFQVAGADGKYVDAQASINGSTVEVWSPSIKAPLSVRYCFTNSAVPELFATVGHLPVAPFRTDHENYNN